MFEIIYQLLSFRFIKFNRAVYNAPHTIKWSYCKRLRCCEFKKCGKIHLVKLQAYSFNFSTSRILQIFSEHFSTRTVQNRSFWSTKTLAVSLKLIAVLGTFYITEGKGFRNKSIYKLFAWFKLLWLKIKKYRCNIGIILKMFALIIPLVFFRLLKL